MRRASASTDINGNATTYLYDVLCRPTQVNLPGGNYTKTAYVNFGNPDAQHVETRVRAPGDAPGEIWSRDYSDGLGRVYATVKQGPATTASDATIRVERDFNTRGYVAYETLPFYGPAMPAGNYPGFTTSAYEVYYGYDKLDRLTKITNADGSFTSLVHSIGSGLETANVTVTDEASRIQSFGFDFGRQADAADQVDGPARYGRRHALRPRWPRPHYRRHRSRRQQVGLQVRSWRPAL